MTMFLVTCQETKEDLKKPISEKDIYKTIGEEIPFESGMEWIRYFQNQNKSGQGKTELISSYVVSHDQMAEMLELADLVGVAFHYATDDSGERHIILIPVNESLSLWTPIPGRRYIDANTGGEISRQTASIWAQNFKDENPDEIWFHFFGKNIFDQMSALPFFDSVDIQPAINVLNLTPQLLLIVWNESLISLGRTQNPPAVVYDASNACPPCAAR